MEKFDNHIRNKLEKRTIEPSKASWDKLAQKLGPENKSTNRKSWLGIAASLLVICALSIVWFTRTAKPEKDHQVIVEKTVETNHEKFNNSQTGTDSIPLEDVKNLKNFGIDEPVFESSKKHYAESKPIKSQKESKEFKPNTIAIKDEVLLAENESSDKMIERKANEVFAQVIAMEENANQVTDAEIDSLLKAAQIDIIKENNWGNSRQIDALSLLSEVEWELSIDARNQLFDKLKENFFKLRTAVADRNK